MAGIISNALDTGQTSYQAGTTPYDATLRTVDPATQTVAGQLNTILASGSPYLQRAQSNALDTANSRGLLNTSMAAGAGTAAAIDAALPVAQADANTYTQAASQNQGYQNSAGQFNAGAQNTAALSGAQAAGNSKLLSQQTEEQTGKLIPAQTAASSQLLGQQVAGQSQLQSEASAQKIEQLTKTGDIETALQTLKGSQATDLANIEAQYKELMQTSAGASQLFATSSASINAILADPNTSIAQKQAAVNTQTNMLKVSMAVLSGISNVDLSSLLDFSGVSP